jgi:hypothetical protein
VKENGFQQIFNVVIDNSIIGFDRNEAKLFLQKSLQMHQGNFCAKPFMCIIQLFSSKFEKLDCPLNVKLPKKVYT